MIFRRLILSQGPDAVLAKSTQLEMVLDRDLSFTEAEMQFPNAVAQRPRCQFGARVTF